MVTGMKFGDCHNSCKNCKTFPLWNIPAHAATPPNGSVRQYSIKSPCIIGKRVFNFYMPICGYYEVLAGELSLLQK